MKDNAPSNVLVPEVAGRSSASKASLTGSLAHLGLDDKVILVTGGSRGIGASTVELLRLLGAQVAYIHATEDVIGPESAFDSVVDVRDWPALDQCVQEIEGSLGPIYGVVANAGVTRDGLFETITPDDWRTVIDVNLYGVYHTLRATLPKLKARGEGSVVMVSSVVGERGNVGQSNYAASKSALIGMTKSLAREYARFGVRCNAIAPGFINTSMLEPVPDKIKERLLSEIPLRRFGNPEEIAYPLAFLLSPLASYITGEVLRINGGYHT